MASIDFDLNQRKKIGSEIIQRSVQRYRKENLADECIFFQAVNDAEKFTLYRVENNDKEIQRKVIEWNNSLCRFFEDFAKYQC